MIHIGDYNTLTVVRKVDFGYYLDGGELGEILLPQRYAPKNIEINSTIDVFIYCDSEDRPIATTQKPYAKVGEFAYLRCVSVEPIGAFLDWGLKKELMVPFREQKISMIEGKMYIVAVFLDKLTNRVAASSKVEKFLSNKNIGLTVGDEVEILVYKQVDIGYYAVINNTYNGLLYKNEIFQPISKGMKFNAYIKKIRSNNDIDLSLIQPGKDITGYLADRIYAELVKNDGYLPLNDKSPVNEIHDMFHESKKNFKKAIGALYKERLIIIEPKGIRIIHY
jgi:uncharacterized protein